MTTTTLAPTTQCSVHQLPTYTSREAADQEQVRRNTRAALSGTPAPQLVLIRCRCRKSGQPNTWHLQRARATTPGERAQALVRELSGLHQEWVDAGVVPGPPSSYEVCEHPRGCDRPESVTVTSTDPLTGDRGQGGYCQRHARPAVVMLLEDPHRGESVSPGIDVEVRCVP